MPSTKITYSTVQEAIAHIQSGQRVFIHGSACTPHILLRELAAQKDRLQNVELVSISLQGEVPIAAPEYAGHFHINSLFVSEPIRAAVNEGRADFIPVFLSDIPDLLKYQLPLDVTLVQVSPPDEHGYCSLGLSVDIARTAVSFSKCIIAQVNPNMPRTLGDGMIHIDRFTCAIFGEEKLPQIDYGAKCGSEEMAIGAHVAALIEDGSTLQMGIGTIPDAVLKCLSNHKNLGIHTEMCSDGIVDLIQNDVVNNKLKKIDTYKTITGFAMGTDKLYNYVHNNPSIAFRDIDYVNEPGIIKLNPKVIAINSAVEVDITGQVCADSIGYKQFSGIGGQMDFMRGAALSEGGKPIIALTSRTKKGISRIVPALREGAGVVTTRGHIHYVVTEHGVAYLYGKNLRQRAKALIEIAHPDDRETLEQSCYERFKIF